MIEKWEEIEGYEGYYEVSNFGVVRGINRIINNRKIKGIYLKAKLNKKGYKYITLCKNKKLKHFTIHRLIAKYFLDFNGEGMKCVVDHIDGDKTNNNINNLQILTNRENVVKSIDKSKTSSKYVGVYYDKKKNKWKSQIHIDGKTYSLGTFNNEYDAHLEYEKKLGQI